MQFGEIYGNDALKARLKKMVDEDRLSHAILFVEQEGMGGLAFALALAQYINCTDRGQDSCGECPSCRRIAKLAYPDVHFAFPVNTSPKLSDQEKKKPLSSYFLSDWNNLVAANPYFDSHELYEALGIENKAATISVHEAREIASALALQPFESDYKIMIIWQPEKMNTEAANKLLKLLEEPPAGTYFLMVTQSLESMLTTVRSRCQIIRLQPMEREEIADVLCKRYELERPLALDFATLAGGFMKGTHLDDKRYYKYMQYRQADEILIKAPSPIDLGMDGESLKDTEFRIKNLKGAVRFALPKI